MPCTTIPGRTSMHDSTPAPVGAAGRGYHNKEDTVYMTITIRVAENAVTWNALAEKMLAISGPAEVLGTLLDTYSVGQTIAAAVAQARAKLAAEAQTADAEE